MSSPEFVRPELTDYDKEKLLQSFKKIQASIDNAIQTRDLSKTCAAFEIPVLGPLTGLEAVNFVIYHTKRHVHQLKNKLSDAIQKKRDLLPQESMHVYKHFLMIGNLQGNRRVFISK